MSAFQMEQDVLSLNEGKSVKKALSEFHPDLDQNHPFIQWIYLLWPFTRNQKKEDASEQEFRCDGLLDTLLWIGALYDLYHDYCRLIMKKEEKYPMFNFSKEEKTVNDVLRVVTMNGHFTQAFAQYYRKDKEETGIELGDNHPNIMQSDEKDIQPERERILYNRILLEVESRRHAMVNKVYQKYGGNCLYIFKFLTGLTHCIELLCKDSAKAEDSMKLRYIQQHTQIISIAPIYLWIKKGMGRIAA